MNKRMISFDNFIKTIDLEKYREKYSKIKIVELDLPPNIQALDSMYKVYWEEIDINNIKSFEEYYEYYLNEKKELLEEFRIKTGMCNICFYKGLEARIYRTWASIITQIHAGYVAETVFGENNVKQSTILDHQGIDIQIIYNDKPINIQIKKESKRPIARIQRNKSDNEIIIKYVVPTKKDIENPYYTRKPNTGKLKPQVMDLIEFNKDNGILNRYDNGFIVFTDRIFKNIKDNFS